ncbi:type VI secretion system contractile sheath small subunit [Pseudomonas aeruginosa]|nr:type VI secretion system contractile sheath small subunit [Pseudomonas aeruginosa]
MAGKKKGSVAPKERINISYVPATNGQQEEVELPLKVLVVGDLKGRAEDSALEERTAVRINKDNFNEVLEKAEVRLAADVPAVLAGSSEGDTISVDLRFNSIDDFSPDSIIRNVPELRKLHELREALVALRGPMSNIPAFRKQLQAMLSDEGARSELAKELAISMGGTEA